MSPKVPKKTLSDLKAAAQKGLSTIDVDTLKDKATEATSTLVEKAGELKDAAVAAKDDIADKLTELDRMLQESVTEYNDAYTIMNDKGVQLYIERCRSLDSISFVESLVNSIANRPKSFDAYGKTFREENCEKYDALRAGAGRLGAGGVRAEPDRAEVHSGERLLPLAELSAVLPISGRSPFWPDGRYRPAVRPV